MKDSPALKWAQLKVTEKILQSRSILESMAGNGNFTTPNPALADVKKATDILEIAEKDVLENGGGSKWIKKRDTATNDLDALMGNLVKYVDNVANGDPNIILSAGMPLKKHPSPASRLSAPQNLLAKPMEKEGMVKLQWKAVKDKLNYKVQKSNSGEAPDWADFDNNLVSENSLEISGLEGGKKIWWRVCAINSKGEGNWSDPATCRVP